MSFAKMIFSSPSVPLPANSTWPGPYPHWAWSTDGNLWIFSKLAGARVLRFPGTGYIFPHIFESFMFFLPFLLTERCGSFHMKLLIFQWPQNFIFPFLTEHFSPALMLETVLYWRYLRVMLIMH